MKAGIILIISLFTSISQARVISGSEVVDILRPYMKAAKNATGKDVQQDCYIKYVETESSAQISLFGPNNDSAYGEIMIDKNADYETGQEGTSNITENFFRPAESDNGRFWLTEYSYISKHSFGFLIVSSRASCEFKGKGF